MSSPFDVIVLGAGISGLVSASVLERQGAKRILLIDEYDHIGGNHIDRHYGDFTFDIGSFIFQDDSPLLAHFPELLPFYVPIEPTFGRLNPQKMVTRYPISVRDDLVRAGPLELSRIMLSVVKARLFHWRQKHARGFARYWIGDRLLTRSGLENYMRRFYGVAPDKIDIRFARARMLWIREHAMVATHIHRLFKPLPKVPGNTQLARPKKGFSHLYEAARRNLEARGTTIVLGAPMKSLTHADGVFRLEAGGQTYESNRVVSTIPIPRAQALCGIPLIENLQTVTMISLFFSFAGERGFPHSVLFNFSHNGAWKRLTVYSDFYGRVEGREYFGVEVNADHVGDSVAEAEKDFRRHVTENKLFMGDLRLEGSHTLETAYPIYTDGASERAEAGIASLRAFGIESLGRQGAFDYQPTARASTQKAEWALEPASKP